MSAISIDQNQQVVVTNANTLQKDTLKARQLLQQEEVYETQDNYQAGIEVAQEAYTLYTKHALWEDAIRCMVSLSKWSDYHETADSKIKYSNSAFELAQQHLPPEHPLQASAFRQKAEAFMRVENLDSSNLFFLKALPIFEKHQKWEDWAWTKLLLGVNYLNQYQLDSSQKHFYEVKKMLEQEAAESLPPDDKVDIQSSLLSFFGILYELQGDYDEAIQNTHQALSLELDKPQLSSADSTYVIDYLNNLGAFYLIKGDYQRSLDYFMQGINSFDIDSKDIALLSNIGELLRRQGKYSAAIDYFQKSLSFEISNEEQLKSRVNTFVGLGSTFIELGLYDSALHYCQQAIELPTDYRKPIIWSIIGNSHNTQTNPSKALEYLYKAERTYLQDSTATAHSSFTLSLIYRFKGDAYFLKNDLDSALFFYQKALIVNHVNFTDSLDFEANPSLEGIYVPMYFWKTMREKANALAAFDNPPSKTVAALETYQVLIQYMDDFQNSHATETASLEWSEKFKQVYEQAIEVAFRLYQNTQEQKYLEAAFIFSEKSKNTLLLESLKASEGKFIAGVPDSLLQKEKDLNIDIAFYEKMLQKEKGEQDEAKTKLYQNYLSQSRLQLVELREKLERDFPKFYDLKYGGKTTSIAKVQSELLNEKTTFVEYFIGDSSAFAFVITQNSAELLQLETPSKLQKRTSDFHTILLDPNTFRQDAKKAFADYQTKSYALYQSVLQPIISTLSYDIQQLIIVPDGFLNTLPFETLTQTDNTSIGFDFGKMPYLLYDYQIQYAYSADLLFQNQNRQKQLPSNANCLAFAPSYQGLETIAARGKLDKLRNTTENLQGTVREIQAIGDFFGGQFDMGKTATEKRFKKLAPQFGILHLAMHGVPDFDNANFNHLKFSDFENETDTLEDNLLHHYEIANMDLQAQLVVLSACETGIGKYEKGEGVYSLARSFMYAGVPSVVMSLWKVSDQSTSELMPYFYERLVDGQSKEVALHGAKVRFLEESDLEYRHPFYWSAFVLMGDAEEIHQGYRLFWFLGIGVLVFGGLGLWFWRRNYQ